MPCPVMRPSGFSRNMLNRIITSVAWWLADWLGWRTALAVYPPTLRDKVAIVTGANAGLGLETSKALLQQGATVIMVCRSLQHGHTAREDILRDTRNHGAVGDAARRLIVMHADYEDFGTIRKFADDFHKLGLPLHVLVNNAGVHLKPYKHVDCGFERTIATNFFGHFYLTQLLLDDLKASAPARVINVASVSELLGPIMYTRSIPWDDLRGVGLKDSGEHAYVMAKTYLLMANTRELARRLEGTGVDVIAVHPGIADSTWYLKSDDVYLFSWVVSRVRSVAPFLGCGQPVTSGAISSIYASIAPELGCISSSPSSHGIVDSVNRALFGGRLIYFGPIYLGNLFGPWNFLNTSRCWVVNPWAYNKNACKKLYESTLQLISQVESELGSTDGATQTQEASDGGLAQGSNQDEVVDSSYSSGQPASTAFNGGNGGGLKQRQQAAAMAAAPMGVEEVHTLLSAEAQPLRGA